ncbi:hypothetical protein NIES208_13555 [[Limnothrix rosea] IAM M-220]|nr:hypothetical protein NIES208_13555 [[Limnothrix rosea] IAM M-220]
MEPRVNQLKIQNELLAQIAKGEPLADILKKLVNAIEATLDQTICSVVLLQQPSNKLRHSSAPHLPEAYKDYYKTIDHDPLQDNASPCTRAILRCKRVILPDIAASSLTSDYKNIATGNGLYACWSMPILGSHNHVLGAFALYYKTRRSPQDHEIEIVTQLTNLAVIAIERHHLEEQQRQREAQFLKIQQVAHIGNWNFDVPTQTVTWSPEMFRIYGLTGQTTAPSYAEFLQMLPEETSQNLQQFVSRALTTGEPYTIEYSFVRPDGSISHHECRGEVEYNHQGQVQRLIGTALDITERRNSELALQNLVAGTAMTGQDFFSALVQNIAEALGVAHAIVTEKVGDTLTTLAFWADGQLMPTYKYALAHTPCEHVFRQREFFCNQNVQQYFPLDGDLVKLEAESYLGIALVNRQDQEIGHLYILHKQTIANPGWAKQVLQVFAARAATELERQQAESTIKQQLAAMEAAVDGISLLRDGIYVYANQAHLSLFGYDNADELMGQSWRDLHSPAEVERMETEVLPHLAREQAWQGEAIATRKDGSTFTGEISWTMTDEGLQIQVYRDVSERKQAENALQNLIRGTAASTGEDFFPALTRHIATALDVSYAIVSEYTDEKLKTLAFWANGELQPNLIYNPVHTPCELTLQRGQFYCEHSVQQRFPKDHDLVAMGADSYLGIALKDSNGESIGDLCILHQDKILAPHRAEQILQVFAARASVEVERLRANAANKRQLEAIEAAIDGISILQNGQYLYVNQAYLELFGYADAAELIGKSWRSLYSTEEMARLETQVIPMLQKKRAWQGEAIATRKDGSTFAQGLSLTLTDDNLLISVCRDISELKQAQALITHNALHDPLTKLPNRTLLLERLALAIQRAQRLNKYNYAVLFLDLDRFKVINDSLGHTVGDQLLVAIAKKLKTHLRKTDLVARLGGDEFLILLEDFHHIDDVIHIVERMLADCQTPLTINEHKIFYRHEYRHRPRQPRLQTSRRTHSRCRYCHVSSQKPSQQFLQIFRYRNARPGTQTLNHRSRFAPSH